MKSWLMLFLAFSSFIGRAEPFYPRLRSTEADGLRAKLRQAPPGAERVDILLRLSNDLISWKYQSPGALDSARLYNQQAKALSAQLPYLAGQVASDYAIANLLDSRDRYQARSIYRRGIARSRQLHNPYQEAVGWYALGDTYDNSLDSLPQRLHCYQEASRLFRVAHAPEPQARSLKEVADRYLRQNKPALARQELLRVVALYQACQHRELHYTFDLLAAANDALGNYKEALQNGLAAIQSAKTTQDTAYIGNFYARVGGMYQGLNQREKAIAYYRLAMQRAEPDEYRFGVLDKALSIAHNLIVLGRPQQALALVRHEQQAFPPNDQYSHFVAVEALATCYLATKQYARATNYSQQLIALSKEGVFSDSHRMQLRMYLIVGKCQLATRQYAQAQLSLAKALHLSQQAGLAATSATASLLLFKVDSARGELISAMAHYQRYKAYNDSIFNEKNSRQIAALQVQYDTEKKEQSIVLLTKQTQVQQLTIRQRGFQRNVFVAGAALLALLLGLGYSRYRLGQRSNRLLEEKRQLLEAQQAEISQKNQSLEKVVSEKDQLLEERQLLLMEKDWMLKEIHHRVKNNLQVVSSLLATQSRHLRDPQAQSAIRESESRVQVMAILHQKLYQADSIARVNMAEYGREIITYLLQSFDQSHAVQTKLDLVAVELDATLATPLGLIINEAVTNALKHAFFPPRRGTITVGLISLAPQQYQLTIADDGVGLPPNFDLKRSRSLGMVIIKGLSRQIDGDLSVTSTAGVCLTLQFTTTKTPAYAEAV